MNRSNIWIHIGLAVVLVMLAAVVGQIERWKSSLRSTPSRTESVDTASASKPRALAGTPEVLVRFKLGANLDVIRAIAAERNDVVTDEIEAVSRLVEINDLDDASPETVAAEYAALDLVEYAEPNYRINLDDRLFF